MSYEEVIENEPRLTAMESVKLVFQGDIKFMTFALVAVLLVILVISITEDWKNEDTRGLKESIYEIGVIIIGVFTIYLFIASIFKGDMEIDKGDMVVLIKR